MPEVYVTTGLTKTCHISHCAYVAPQVHAGICVSIFDNEKRCSHWLIFNIISKDNLVKLQYKSPFTIRLY